MTGASRQCRTPGLIAAHFTPRITRLLRARPTAMAVPLHTALICRRFLAVRRRSMERSGSKAMKSNRMPEFSLKFRHLGHALSMADTVVLDHGACPGGAAISLGNGAGTPALGRYQIGRKLGKGATGDVYLGKDRKIGRVVAVKILALPQESGCDELKSAKERFFREAETAGRLNHPGIVTILDTGEERDLAYIAMEFLKGRDLASYAGPGDLLPLPRVLSIAARVAEALDYAHSRGIVHRDVKPANIMYEADSDTVKVTDFGIAGITDSSRAVGGTVLGTPCYMSPEQLSERKTEGCSDLFSLGVTLYQLSCGYLPFRSSSMAQLMLKIANEPHTDILDYNPVLPGCVVDVVNKALAKQPERRYQTGNEMALALRACIAGAAQSKSGSMAVNF